LNRSSKLRLAPREARLLRFFEHGFGADDDDHAAFGDGVAGAVGIGIEADDGAFGQVDVAVDDGAADAAAAADAESQTDAELVVDEANS
jgi:hypothetical protein